MKIINNTVEHNIITERLFTCFFNGNIQIKNTNAYHRKINKFNPKNNYCGM